MFLLSQHTVRRLKLFVLGMLLIPCSYAVPILDTYGPGGTANGLEYTVYNNDPGDGQSLAVQLILTQSALITDITGAFFGTGQFELGIHEGSLQPGSLLYSTTLLNPRLDATWGNLGWSLTPGTYWISLQAASGASGVWLGGNQEDSAMWAATFGGAAGEWSILAGVDTPALLVQASAVDEAQTWLLFATGGALVAGLSRTQRRARLTRR